jgi:hypothetical protein
MGNQLMMSTVAEIDCGHRGPVSVVSESRRRVVARTDGYEPLPAIPWIEVDCLASLAMPHEAGTGCVW